MINEKTYDNYVVIGAKLCFEDIDNPDRAFTLCLLNNRDSLAERVTSTHKEFLATSETIKSNTELILSGQTVDLEGEFYKTFEFLKDKDPRYTDDVYFTILYAAQGAFLTRNNEDRADATLFMEMVDRVYEDIDGFSELAVLSASMWFSDYKGYREKVIRKIDELKAEGYYEEPATGEKKRRPAQQTKRDAQTLKPINLKQSTAFTKMQELPQGFFSLSGEIEEREVIVDQLGYELIETARKYLKKNPDFHAKKEIMACKAYFVPEDDPDYEKYVTYLDNYQGNPTLTLKKKVERWAEEHPDDNGALLLKAGFETLSIEKQSNREDIYSEINKELLEILHNEEKGKGVESIFLWCYTTFLTGFEKWYHNIFDNTHAESNSFASENRTGEMINAVKHKRQFDDPNSIFQQDISSGQSEIIRSLMNMVMEKGGGSAHKMVCSYCYTPDQILSLIKERWEKLRFIDNKIEVEHDGRYYMVGDYALLTSKRHCFNAIAVSFVGGDNYDFYNSKDLDIWNTVFEYMASQFYHSIEGKRVVVSTGFQVNNSAGVTSIYFPELPIAQQVYDSQFVDEGIGDGTTCEEEPEWHKESSKAVDVKLSKQSSGGGCYVATAVYGSYDCPQVWTLRRYRDEVLSESRYGRNFIRAYYAVSPTLVKWFGNHGLFKTVWKKVLDRMVGDLQKRGFKDTPYNDRQR